MHSTKSPPPRPTDGIITPPALFSGSGWRAAAPAAAPARATPRRWRARLLAAVACAAAAAEERVLGELWDGALYELTEEALDLVLAMPGEAPHTATRLHGTPLP